MTALLALSSWSTPAYAMSCSDAVDQIIAWHTSILHNPEKSIVELESVRQKEKNPTLIFAATAELAFAHALNNAPGHALQMLRMAQQQQTIMTLNGCESFLERRSGNVHYLYDNYENALLHYTRSLTLEQESPSSERFLADTLNNVGLLYREMNQYSDAEVMITRSSLLQEKVGKGYGVAAAKLNLCEVKRLQNKLAEARTLAEFALDYFSRENDVRHTISALYELAAVASAQQLPKSVMTYFLQAQALVANDQSPWRAELLGFEESLAATQQVQLLEHVARTVLDDGNARAGQRLSAHRVLEKIAVNQSRYDLAYQHQHAAAQLQADISKTKSLRRAEFLQAQFESAQKQHEIDALHDQTTLQQLQIEKQKERLVVLIMTTLLVLSVLTFYGVRHQHRRELDQAQQLNKKLQELDSMKDQVLTNTSHELRTPLNGIVGMSELLLLDNKLSAETRSHIELIAQSGKRLTNVISDVLDFAQLRQHKTTLQQDVVPLAATIDIVIRLMTPLCANKPLQLRNEIDTTLLVLADSDRLQQIVCNLIGNAIKFTARGHINLRAQRLENKIRIAVTDTGEGIPAEAQQRIFNSFEQAHGAMNRHHEGVGLGLAITKQLVHLHGGEIGVESTLGVGSTFWFTLPAAH